MQMSLKWNWSTIHQKKFKTQRYVVQTLCVYMLEEGVDTYYIIVNALQIWSVCYHEYSY